MSSAAVVIGALRVNSAISEYIVLGPVVQSILSLTNSLRGQLVKCFTTLLLNTLIFFVEKMREAFHSFQQKI